MNSPTTLALIVLGGASGTALASITQTNAPAPGGYAQAGAFPSTCGCSSIDVGANIATGFGPVADFDEQSFTGSGTGSASALHSVPDLDLSMQASSGLGFARFNGENTHLNSAFFAAAIADAGWKDVFTVSHPSLNGQIGFMVFRVRARGQFEASGFSGAASLWLKPFRNNLSIPTNAHYHPGNADIGGAGEQAAFWALSSDSTPVSRNLDGFATFSAPITFGQPFTLGVFARATAGQRSASGFPGSSVSTLNFGSQGVTWDGIASIRDANGTLVAGATIDSGSGIDWNPPIALCDSIDFNGDGLFPDTQDIDDFL
ncbi:MAG TPA: hypothetical protein VHN77_02585, partial [Phycisphaerales bacterium]|nr:hypothetical protein [Phycisphaerales bacterium]